MTDFTYWLGIATVACPIITTAILGIALFLGFVPGEPLTHRILQLGVVVGLLASIGIFTAMQITGEYRVLIDLGVWVTIPPHYHFHIELLFDRLSVPFCALIFVLCGTIASFAQRYMHRERGYHRFFMLYSIFMLGMVTAAVAGTVETLYAGWELVGLSSVLLIGFFNDRPGPVRNGYRVWVIYRISDAALLLAAVLTHRLVGEGDFHKLIGEGVWPNESAAISPLNAAVIGGLLLVAAAGKSALLPFCGWLPRAMEGPTPSSAVFYGALSVHLGAFLLLRVSPLFERSDYLAAAAVSLGLATAVYGYLVGRVQTDIKSVLSFASLTQVGIIVAEIGLGFRYIALVHLLGHACLRTLQFLRAPSLLLDYKIMENALGEKLPRNPSAPPTRFQVWLYRFALERGYLDSILDAGVAKPFAAFFRFLTAWETRSMNRLNGIVPTGKAAPSVVVVRASEHAREPQLEEAIS